MKLSIPEAALAALIGYAVVFVGLILLMAVVMLTGKVMVSRKQNMAAPAPATPTPAPAPAKVPVEPAPGSAGEVSIYDVPDRQAALIMAIVADKVGKPLNELRFKSIKEVK